MSTKKEEEKKGKRINKIWKEEAEWSESGGDFTEKADQSPELLVVAKRFLKLKWHKKRPKFMPVWEKMKPKSREDLIRALFPYAPLSPTTPTLVVKGKVRDVSMNCILFEQLCISNLVPDNKLIELMDARADTSKDDQHWIYHDYHFIKSLIQKKVLDGNLSTVERGFVFLYPNEWFGNYIKIPDEQKEQSATVQTGFANEFLVNVDVFWHLLQYETTLYSVLCGIIQELDTEILGKETHEFYIHMHGCSKCGKFSWEENQSQAIKFCQCKSVAYCSKECQKSDWPGHKPNHNKEMELRKQRKGIK